MEDLTQYAHQFDHWLEAAIILAGTVLVALKRVRRAFRAFFKTLREKE